MEIQEKDQLSRRLTGLIWGRTKAGKTSLLATLPPPILYIMIDPDGENSIPEWCDYKLLDLSKLSDEETIIALKDKVPTMIKNTEGINSVVVDSLTVFAERGLNLAIKKGVGSGKNFSPTIEEPGQTAYGARRQYLIHAVSNVLRATAGKGQHCFFTTHDAEVLDKQGNLVEYTLMLGGKAANDMGLKISELWFLSSMDGVRKLQVQAARMRNNVGTRMFETSKAEPEFILKFDPAKGPDQPHSIAKWYQQWLDNGRKKIPLPK